MTVREMAPEEAARLTDAFVTASRALVGMAVRSLAASPVEITVPQHRALVLLAGAGATTIGRLAEQLGVNASNASRLCDRLERLGLAARRRSEDDARAVQVALTRAGRAALAAVDAHRREEIARVLSDLPARDAAAIIEALDTFSQAAHELSAADWDVTR